MFAKTLPVHLAECIRVPAQGLSPLLERRIHERLVFTNPDYEQRSLRGEWLGNIPAQISLVQKAGRDYVLPRGFLDQFLELCRHAQQPVEVTDKRRLLPPVEVEFQGRLKDYQQDAAEAVLARDSGTLLGGNKSGKTVIALYTVAERRQPTLVILPRPELVGNWLMKIEHFLRIPREQVGLLTKEAHRVGGVLTLAVAPEAAQSWRELREIVGYVIADECQTMLPRMFTQVIPRFDARYMLALANTVQKRDHLPRVVYAHVGDVVYSIDEREAREGRGVIQARILPRRTAFEHVYHSRADYAPLMEALMADEGRARFVADDIEEELRGAQDPVLILHGGAPHFDVLSRELGMRGIGAVPLDEARDEDPPAPTGPLALFATPDVLPRLAPGLAVKAIFLACPVYFRKGLAEAVQRLVPPGKEPSFRIYDYVDDQVAFLDNSFRMRSYAYGAHPDALLSRDAARAG